MRLTTLFLLISLSATVECGAQTAAVPAPADAAAPVSAPDPAAAVPEAAPAAAPTPALSPAKPASTVKVPSGFKAKTRNGQTVYCKKVAQIGSRFEQETCMTEAEAAELARKADSDRDQFRRNQTICGTGGCGGS